MIKQRRSSWRGSSATTAQLGVQDKSREVRPGRLGVVSGKITRLARGARFRDSLSESRKARPTAALAHIATKIARTVRRSVGFGPQALQHRSLRLHTG
jgi:hypothetical protein